ncbi:MAG: hypothetical protein HZB87_12045 [Desulfatitalea sp.]|nr:hypothetical protein [Desulfatitalea sp.]
MDQDKDAQKSSPEGDDELENLSSDEKAAFEKIMAEIATATGGASKGNADDAAKKSKPGSSGKPSSTAPPIAGQEAPPADSAQADLDQIMSEITSKKEGKNAGVPGTADNKVSVDPPSDDLSKDQQAALDQIMAEIGSKRKAEITPAPNTETADKADEDLNQDQQAALDSIMAEIGSKRKAEKIPEAKSETTDKADETLNADQQAALDSIMA